MEDGIRSDEKAFREVIGKLVSRDLKPGDRIFEPRLCGDLGMSRTPVRQALARLMEAGILVKIPNQKGYKVPKLTLEDMEQIFTSRSIIEGACAFFATEKCSREEIAFLKELNSREEEFFYSGDKHAYAAINEKIHSSLYEYCRNPYLKKFATLLYWRSQLYTFHMGYFYNSWFIQDRIRNLQESGHVSYLEHRCLINALEKREPAKAKIAMEKHIRKTFEHYAKAKAVDIPTTQISYGINNGGDA